MPPLSPDKTAHNNSAVPNTGSRGERLRAYLAGEIDAATYQRRIREIVTGSATGRAPTA